MVQPFDGDPDCDSKPKPGVMTTHPLMMSISPGDNKRQE